MIIVRLIGGLGNQLFQYAAARRLSYFHNVPLILDITGFSSYKLHRYSLHPFNIIENFASDDELSRIKKPLSAKLKSPIQLLIDTLNRESQIIPMTEKTTDFEPRILNLPDNVYLDGYWQSEKYFRDFEKIIRHEFSIKIPPDPLNKKIGDKISREESVSIHVRRGDYVGNSLTNQIHGVCDETYFQKAIEVIANKTKNPHFFVFSDDPKWAKKNITANAPIDFVTHNDASKNFEDLRLMGLCKHHIIANSSFSWWGAWLASNENKIVIGPSKWFIGKEYNDQDRMPEKWLRV